MSVISSLTIWAIALLTLSSACLGQSGDDVRPPLIPQGARIVEASGSLAPGLNRAGWVFEPAPPMPKGTRLLVMPSRAMEEMEDHLADNNAATGTFVITGRVFQWRGENYLLPDEVQLPPAARSGTGEEEGDSGTPPPNSDSDRRETWSDDGPGLDEVAAITRALHDTVGGVTPLLNTGGADTAASFSEVGSVAAILHQDRTSPPIALSAPAVTAPRVLIARRGTLRRSNHGAVVLILDAQETGTVEMPLVILPSPLYDIAHRLASTMNGVTPVEVTGEVIAYRSRRFLLPSGISPVNSETTLGLPHPVKERVTSSHMPSATVSQP